MELDETDLRVFTAVELRARTPLRQIARELRVHEHTVRRSIDRMIAGGVIKSDVFVNLYALGIREFVLDFSLGADRRSAEARVIQACIDSDRVSHLATVGGDYQYSMSICCKDVLEVHEFLNEISARFGAVFFSKQISAVVSLSDYGVKSLHRGRRIVRTLRFGSTKQAATLDDADHRILSQLMSVPHATTTELARALGAPATTVAYRLRQLEAAGILVGYRYVRAVERSGLHAFRFLIAGKSVSQQLTLKFLCFCQDHPAITFAIECIGSCDFQLGVLVPSAVQAMELSQEICRTFGDQFNSVQVSPVFGLLKLRKYPFRRWPY